MNPLDRWLEGLGERMNPILVREVRRAMKGQVFVIAFMSVLLLGLLGTGLVLLTVWRESIGGLTHLPGALFSLQLSDSGERPAQILFGGLFFLLSIAVTGVVPLLAFFSMTAERDESTLDLLSLASLKPGAIVRGKLFSLALQALLFYAAVTPFLAVCFLMRGLSLEVFLLGMGMSVILCATLTSLGLLLSCLRVPKIARLALLVLFGMFAYGANMAIVFGIGMTAQNPGVMAQMEFRVTCGVLVGVMLFLTCFSLAFSPGQLAHAEENRSTGPRLATTVFVLLLILGNIGLQKLYIDREIRFVIQWLSFYFLAIPLTMFVSEPEKMGRRLQAKLGRVGLSSVLLTPWLPGGGRGVIFAVLHLGLLFFAGPYLDPSWAGAPATLPATGLPVLGFGDAHVGLQVTALYLLIFLGLGPAIFSRWTKAPLVRVFSGLSVPCLALLAFFAMTLVRSARIDTYSPEAHWANPFLVPERVFLSSAGAALSPVLKITLTGALIVLVLNLKRMWMGWFEVFRAATVGERVPATLPDRSEGVGA